AYLPCLALSSRSVSFKDLPPIEIYTLSLHDALPICRDAPAVDGRWCPGATSRRDSSARSEPRAQQIWSRISSSSAAQEAAANKRRAATPTPVAAQRRFSWKVRKRAARAQCAGRDCPALRDQIISSLQR